ncbi:MAG TPA: MFS transporter [Anaerolineae bacterium]|nr:MFS transporter [Anaerolineae bacterium]HID83634.1 hypothetical protein [Anaerolineales bacterium]
MTFGFPPALRERRFVIFWLGLMVSVAGSRMQFWGLALALTGATDTVSMVIRNTIRQLQTPDELRGRMTSINQIFFVDGPQPGELEAGLAAQMLGAPLAVVTDGLGCILAVGWIAKRWPQLLRYNGDEPILAGAG